MTILTAKARNALPEGVFAGPGRSYPVPDAGHAANAKARAEQQYKRGGLSASEKEAIDAEANRVLARSQ